MRIEELDNRNALEPGQLLVVLKCWRFYDNADVCHLQQSVKSGLLQFYRHRQEPVPWICRPKNYRLFRHPRTTSERRAYFSSTAAKEILESHGVAFKVRQKRSPHWLPNFWEISLATMSEAGKRIVRPSERTRAASTAESTAVRAGLGEATTQCSTPTG